MYQQQELETAKNIINNDPNLTDVKKKEAIKILENEGVQYQASMAAKLAIQDVTNPERAEAAIKLLEEQRSKGKSIKKRRRKRRKSKRRKSKRRKTKRT